MYIYTHTQYTQVHYTHDLCVDREEGVPFGWCGCMYSMTWALSRALLAYLKWFRDEIILCMSINIESINRVTSSHLTPSRSCTSKKSETAKISSMIIGKGVFSITTYDLIKLIIDNAACACMPPLIIILITKTST